jgi:hypothetical protein
LIEELKEKEDMFQAIALLQRCYEEMQYGQVGHSFDIKSVFNSLVSCMENGIVLIFKEVRILGIGCIFFFPSIMDANHIMASELVWHADPYLKKMKRAKIMISLLKEMENKVREKGFKSLYLSTSIDFPAIANYLKKKGYKLRQKDYYKEV